MVRRVGVGHCGGGEGPDATTAKWTGKGSTDDRAHFVCVDGKRQAAAFRVP